MKKSKALTFPLNFVFQDLKLNRKHGRGFSLLRSFQMWRLGFFYESYFLFDLKNNNPKEYLTNYERMKTHYINGPYAFLLNNKLVFNSIIENRLSVPKIFAFLKKNCVLKISKDGPKKYEDIISLLEKEKSLILKENMGASGKGVVKLEFKGKKFFWNFKEIKKEELLKELKELNDYICTETINQKGYANEIFPHSANTLRIITYIDPKTQEPFVGVAVHRFGNDASKPTDNFKRGMGGIVCLVNIDSGVIEKCMMMDSDFNRVEDLKVHPDTGKEVVGVQIPDWDRVKEDILVAHSSISFIPHIAWDICVSGNDFYVVEGNNHSDVPVIQVHGPLLSNDRVRDFYSFHKIIDR